MRYPVIFPILAVLGWLLSADTALAYYDAKAKSQTTCLDMAGRGIALDRDKNYDRVKRAYDAMVEGTGTLYE